MNSTARCNSSIKGIFFLLLFLHCAIQTSIARNEASNTIEISNLSVDEAYQSVPHRRTQYIAADSAQAQEVSSYIEALFKLTDLALIERINGLNDAYNKKRYQARINQLKLLKTPTQAKVAHELIVAAIEQHQQYFEGSKLDWQLAKSASSKLIKAYYHLMRTFPDNSHNQQAYFDHLCALDFI